MGPGANILSISAGGNGRAFLVTGGSPAISGLTITGGDIAAPDQGLDFAAGGAALITGGSLGLNNDNFNGDSVSNPTGLADGGAVAVVGTGSSVSVSGTSFSDDEASGFVSEGGGVAIVGGAKATILDSTFNGELSQATSIAEGGAVGVDGQSSLTVIGGVFDNDSSQDLPSATLNTGCGGGAIENYGGSQTVVEFSTFQNDQTSGTLRAGSSGGAIDSEGFLLTPEGSGASIPGGTLEADFSTFSHDQAIGESGNQPTFGLGGAVFCDLTDATITGSTFDQNLAEGGTAAPGSGNYGGAGLGGALYIENNQDSPWCPAI